MKYLKDPIFILGLVTLVVALLALVLAPRAHAGMPEDEPLDATPEFERALTVKSALALVTPTPMIVPAEITPSGNVVVSGTPLIVVVIGKAPLTLLPERCRADAKQFPNGSTFLCYPDDSHSRWAHGE